jgi:urease subunit alpha
MFGAFGRALTSSAVTFVSKAAAGRDFGVAKSILAVGNTRSGISKASMIRNSATPYIEVDPETYEVRADGALLNCEPAAILPMAQRYFLY